MYEVTTRRGFKFDLNMCELWFRGEVLTSPMYLPIRTSNAFLVALLQPTPWFPSNIECHVIILVSDEDAIWEAVRLLRYSVEYARLAGCSHWRYHWDDGDAGVLVRRVGAKVDAPRYLIHF
jgi:hypothetical protein